MFTPYLYTLDKLHLAKAGILVCANDLNGHLVHSRKYIYIYYFLVGNQAEPKHTLSLRVFPTFWACYLLSRRTLCRSVQVNAGTLNQGKKQRFSNWQLDRGKASNVLLD